MYKKFMNGKIMKKVIAVAAAAALACTTAGCSSGNASSGTTAGAPGGDAAASQTTAAQAGDRSAAGAGDAAGEGAPEDHGAPADGRQLKVGIIQMIENGAFNDMREGFIQELRDKGYSEDKLTIDYKCAQGDATNLQTIAQGMSDGTYDLVATIATPPTQAMVNQESGTPVIFIAVSAPVAAGVITEMEKPDKNATGTSNAIPVGDIFKLSDSLTPDART